MTHYEKTSEILLGVVLDGQIGIEWKTLRNRIEKALQDAFDLGYQAANFNEDRAVPPARVYEK